MLPMKKLTSSGVAYSPTILPGGPDVRYLYTQPHKLFDARDVSRAIVQAEHAPNPDALRVWKTKLPTKVKFFGWLLTHGRRINTRAYLYHRTIRTREEASCEDCPGILETADHILFQCPLAARLWKLLSINP